MLHLWRRRVRIGGALLLLLVLAGRVPAQPQCDYPAPNNASPDVSLDLLRRTGYFGRGGCDTALYARIERWRGQLARDSVDLGQWDRPATRDSIAAILFTTRVRAGRAIGEGAEGRARFLRRLDALVSEVGLTGLSTSEAEAWRVQAMKIFAGGPDEIDVAGSLAGACEGRPADCPAAYRNSVETTTYAVLTRATLDAALLNNRRAATGYVASLDRRWTAYLTKARASYPWEMILNDWLMRRTYRSRGFIAPPTLQMLFLHPDAGLSYVDPASDHLRNILLLEGLGFYTWKWDRNDQMKSAFGFAYVTAWNGDDANRISQGLLLHVPQNLSVGVTWSRNHSKYVPHYVVSGDVGKLFTDRTHLAETLISSALKGLE